MTGRRFLHFALLAGRLLSPLYALAMRIRAALYAAGVLPSVRLPLPVISVGNVSMGGTGKTPMVIYLCRLLSSRQRRPGIVSRGYGGRNRLPVAVVSDGSEVKLTASQAGDEPVLLGRSLPGVPVVIARKRSAGGEFLVRREWADTVLLDDGFQHLALRRDLDIVLLAAGAPLVKEWVFPGGMLREPVSALRRADCLVLTGVNSVSGPGAEELCRWLQRATPETPIFCGSYEPVALYDLAHRPRRLDSLDGARLFAFCGIANPESFRRTLDQGFSVKGFRTFPDHHAYRSGDIDELVRLAKADGCAGLITTEKDFVKVRSFPSELPIWVVAVELRMPPEFDRFVLEKLASALPGKR